MASKKQVELRIIELAQLEKKHALNNKFDIFSTVNLLRREWQRKLKSIPG